MGLQFRKKIKLAPGISLNVGKRGASISAGVKGARVTFGKDKTSTSVGIPGTGISHRNVYSNRTDQEQRPASSSSSSGTSWISFAVVIAILVAIAKWVSMQH